VLEFQAQALESSQLLATLALVSLRSSSISEVVSSVRLPSIETKWTF